MRNEDAGYWGSPRWLLLEAPLASPADAVDGGTRRADGAAHATSVEAIRSGRMPARRPDGVWGGAGQDAPCAICGVPVRPYEVELEVEFTTDRSPRTQRHHVHPRCFAGWETEVRRLEQTDLPDPRDVSYLLRGAYDRLEGGAR